MALENLAAKIHTARNFSSSEVYNIAVEVGQKPRSVRLAEFEKGRLNVAFDPNLYSEVERAFQTITEQLDPDAREFQQKKQQQFEEKLRRSVGRISSKPQIDFPYMGEEFLTADQVNKGFEEEAGFPPDPGVISSGNSHLEIPQTLSAEELINLGRTKYLVEAFGINHVVAGYSREMLELALNHPSKHTDVHFIMRDGRVAFAAAYGLSKQNEKYDFKRNKLSAHASFVNSAMADPLVTDEPDQPSMIYTQNKKAMTKPEVLTYLQGHGVLSPDNPEDRMILLAETASMGTLPIMLEKARSNLGYPLNTSMVTLAGGWQGNPLIPNYTRYLASGNWTSDPNNEDPIVLKKSEIVHTYAENNFAGYTKRPESFKYHQEGAGTIQVLPLEPYNEATSILAWVSYQAGLDTGELHGLLSKNGDSAVNELPKKALETLWSMWTHSVSEGGLDPNMPNIAFCPWRPRHSGRAGILARWNDQLLLPLTLTGKI